MATLFGQQPRAEEVQSEAGDDVGDVGRSPASRPGPSGSAGVFRQGEQARVLVGRGSVGVDMRKFRYDVVRGRGAALPFSVTRDDRLEAEEAGDMLHRIHEIYGVARETEDVLQAFDSAIFFCHTVNGGSVLNPGRSKFTVMTKGEGGKASAPMSQKFDFKVIVDKLGDDLRRFFRAYADEITEVNKRVIRDFDPYDSYANEQRGWLVQVAHARGLSRYPHLAHDSADACLLLTPTERQALHQSKSLVVGSTPNSADKMKPMTAVESAEKFDSSVGEKY